MKPTRATPRWHYVALVLALGALTVCKDGSGPGHPMQSPSTAGHEETVIGPPGTNGEWWMRGELVLDTLREGR